MCLLFLFILFLFFFNFSLSYWSSWYIFSFLCSLLCKPDELKFVTGTPPQLWNLVVLFTKGVSLLKGENGTLSFQNIFTTMNWPTTWQQWIFTSLFGSMNYRVFTTMFFLKYGERTQAMNDWKNSAFTTTQNELKLFCRGRSFSA